MFISKGSTSNNGGVPFLLKRRTSTSFRNQVLFDNSPRRKDTLDNVLISCRIYKCVFGANYVLDFKIFINRGCYQI